MNILLLFIGFVIGWFSRIVYKYFKNIGRLNKQKLYQRGYKPTSYEIIKDILRNIVIRFHKENFDFFMNLNVRGETVIQVLHRSHFPEITGASENIDFGIAIYIPLNDLSGKQRDSLEQILKEHAVTNSFSEVPFSYYVLDIGKKIRYGGELLCLILKEIFDVQSNDVIDVELFDGGKLPYSTINIESYLLSK